MTVDEPLSVGVDVVSIERVATALTDGMVDRVFTEDEANYCRSKADPPQHFAARWAAKEATIKALPEEAPPSLPEEVTLALPEETTLALGDVEVVGTGGQPELKFPGLAARGQQSAMADWSTSVSLTHDRSAGVAAAVVALAADPQTARTCASKIDLAESLLDTGRIR